tara:strand:+ start:59 stop:553 length:495 start_codon:yes stop_codon:yes gene_type:complete
MTKPSPVTTIVSGAQTGADQGGLAAGRTLGLLTAGWVPKDRRTDTGPLTDEQMKRYHLRETVSTDYRERTRLNVQSADGTVWFGSRDSAGYYCTRQAAKYNYGLTWSWRDHWNENPTPTELREWVIKNHIVILNVAGNRERINRGIGKHTYDTLCDALLEENND